MTELCPFTLKNLSNVKEDDLAVIYETNPLLSSGGAVEDLPVPCGHRCTLSQLVSYLHDGKVSMTSCPVCQHSKVSVVCDAKSSARLLQRQEFKSKDCEEGRIISFRFGTTSYYLWVPSSQQVQASSYSSLFNKGEVNALTRISSVFGVDLKKGLKVIHKGKVIYPGKNESSDDISDQMLDISTADIIHRRKKPSLVVMGLSKQQTTPAVAKNNSSISILVYSFVGMFTPRSVISLARWGFQFTVSLIGGVCLFVRSLLYPPQPTQQ